MSEQTKPYHLMTQSERLAKRISDNRAIEKRVEFTNQKLATVKRIRQTRSARTIGGLAAEILLDLGGVELLNGFIEAHPESAKAFGMRLSPVVTFRRISC